MVGHIRNKQRQFHASMAEVWIRMDLGPTTPLRNVPAADEAALNGATPAMGEGE